MRSGTRLAARYRLERCVGRGGMAEVWQACDEVLARPVAVKLMDGRLGTDVLRRRFQDEARAAAGLADPRIVVVHDYGEAAGDDGAPIPYIVMELLSGETLADRIARGPLPVAEALAVCGEIAAALAAAHRSGIVHRDVKPANVFLTGQGVKVLDFGIAGALRPGGDPPGTKDPTEPLLGTPAYLAPERPAGELMAPQVDVYALGIVLTEALTARREADAPLPYGLPAGIAALVGRCRSADPADRPSAAEVADILVAAEPETAPRRPFHVPGAFLVGTVAAGITAAWLLAAVIFGLVRPAGPQGDPAAGLDLRRPATTSPASTPSIHADPDETPTVTNVLSLRPIVAQGLAAGEIRPDVAVDLDNVITNLDRDFAGGSAADRERHLAGLREKIATRVREGGLSRARAEALLAALSRA